MSKKGFTLIELLIVIMVIAILAGLLLPALVKAICAAKEAKAQDIISNMENACKVYERDWNTYPASAMGDPFEAGPCVDALSRPGPKRQPYVEFLEGEVTSFPISQSSNLKNPVDNTKTIHYRNNTANPRPAGGPTIHNKYSVDLWAENCEAIPTGVNNWRASQ